MNMPVNDMSGDLIDQQAVVEVWHVLARLLYLAHIVDSTGYYYNSVWIVSKTPLYKFGNP
jgi:hypothetical protein